jgi:hypothetical protein
MIVGVVSCGSVKLDKAAPARDLYCGRFFQVCSKFVEPRSDRWIILSAKHGVLDPDEIIDPYDLSLRKMSKERYRFWQLQARIEIEEQFPSATFLAVAGENYRSVLPKDRTICPWGEVGSRVWAKQMKWMIEQDESPTWRPELLRNPV